MDITNRQQIKLNMLKGHPSTCNRDRTTQFQREESFLHISQSLRWMD